MESLNKAQQDVKFCCLTSKSCMFVTGRSGSGKTFLLTHLSKELQGHPDYQPGSLIILSFSSHEESKIGGYTAHRWLRECKKLSYTQSVRMWNRIKWILIDEMDIVCSLSGITRERNKTKDIPSLDRRRERGDRGRDQREGREKEREEIEEEIREREQYNKFLQEDEEDCLLDEIDRMARMERNRVEPFGGIQILGFGDMNLPLTRSSLWKEVFEGHILKLE